MKSFYLIVSISGILVIIAIGIVGFCPNCMPKYYSLSDRIGLLEVSVSVVGFALAIFSGWYAAREFANSQLKPNLSVVFENRAHDITEWYLEDVARRARTSFYVSNTGRGVGRYIWIMIKFPEIMDIQVGPNSPYDWTIRNGNNSTIAEFHGSDEFICYPGMNVLVSEFMFDVEANARETYSIEWEVMAQNSDLERGLLQINIVPFDEIGKRE